MFPSIQGAAEYVWTRHRLLIITCALVYGVLITGSAMLSAEQERPYLEAALTFLRAAPFFLPLLLFVSSASVATLDLSSVQSRFPAHFFSLPLSARQLVLPFMAGALVLSALLWACAVWISGGRVLYAGPLDVPLAQLKPQTWYPLLQGSLLIWAQALIWMSYRRRWIRVGALLGLILVHFVALVLAVSESIPSNTMIVLCVLQFPTAYAVAVWGVARARRGEPEQKQTRTREIKPGPRVAQPFASALQAQSWFENRLHRSKNKITGAVVLALVLLLVLMDGLSVPARMNQLEANILLARIGELVLCALALIGVSSGPAFASFQANVSWYKSTPFTMPAFFAALPLSAGDFAWVKIKTAARSMVWLCGVVFAAALLIVLFTSLREAWAGAFTLLSNKHGSIEAGLLLAFIPLALVVLTAAGTANVVWIALIGRAWRVIGVAATLVVASALLFSGWMVRHSDQLPRAIEVLRDALPVLAAAKLGTLAILVHRVVSQRLYPVSRTLWIVGSWVAAIAAVLAMYWRWTDPSPENIATAVFTLIVLMPLLGIIGAPLALQGNRCR